MLAARYTNPLTFLPGPVPIHQHIEKLLERGLPFAACLAEVDPMKGFNDAYGFARCDELIRLGSESLLRAHRIGHPGRAQRRSSLGRGA